MSIRFIYGRAGTGKSTFCIKNIKARLNDNKDDKLILLVPEQYTFITENKILKSIGESAFLKLEVLSFKKMATNVFEECGGRVTEIINESGRNMLIHKVLNENIDSLDYFKKIAKEQGFNETIAEIISEFKKYNIDEEILNNLSKKINNSELNKKLTELSVIYSGFNSKFETGYIDGDDELTLLSKKLLKNNIYKDTEIWIDEFTTFTPQQLNIIKILAKESKKINITLCSEKNNLKSNINDVTSVFNTIQNTENNILKIMKENNVSYEEPIDLNNDSPFRFKNSNELRYIEKNFFTYPFKQFKDEVNDISLYKANNLYDEIDNVAKSIVKLIREKEYRYKDISVVCRNIEDYEKITSVVFKDYNIPYFMDKKMQLLGNPLIVLITAIFEIKFKNWSYESVFKYLKTGLTGVEVEYIDKLENFILEHGIKGYKWTCKNIYYEKWFNNGNPITDENVLIEEIMEAVRKPIIKFHKKIDKKTTVRNICKALYEFLVDIDVFKRIDLLVDKFENSNLENKVKEYNQVQGIVINVLDQAVDVMGDEQIEAFEFLKILNSGFSNEGIGVIPLALDQVNIGDIARIKGRDVKVLYIVGINDGVMPSNNNKEGVLSDRDRLLLRDIGINLASDTRTKAFEEQFLTYTALTISSEYLMLSYPMSDFEGKSLRPSMIISRIKKIFPKLLEESSIYNLYKNTNKYNKIISPIPAFNELILAVRRDFDKEDIEDYWPAVYNWFKNNDNYKDKMENIFKGLEYSNVGDKVARRKLRELYANDMGKLVFSVSRLEKYSQCPFSYFIQYGLKAKNRKVYEFTPPDLGSFVHEILDMFTNKVKTEGILWSDLDKNRCKEMVSNIIDSRLDTEANSILNSSNRYKYLTKRFKRVISKSVSILSEQICKGEFEVFKTEFNFGDYSDSESITLDLDNNEKIYLQGRIDRIDRLELEDETYVRIIDYKTGAKKFDLNELYYGLQMQLLVYLDALIKNSKHILHKQAKPGAVLYFKIDDPLIKSKKNMSDEEVEKEVLEALKLKGLLLKDSRVVKAMDKDMEGYSLIIPASFKKDGDFKSTSDVITEQEFTILRDYVNKKMKDLCEEMLSGDIRLRPIKNGDKKYCEYCDFSSICQFDSNMKENKYQIVIKKSQNEIWNNIRNDLSK